MKMERKQKAGLFLLLTAIAGLFSTTAYAQNDKVSYNGSTYQAFHTGGYTWKEAEKYCEDLGGHLVTITSQEEQEIVKGLLSSGREFYWIGGRRSDVVGQWLWITGESYSYENWAPNQPDNGYSGGEAYMGITAVNTSYASAYKWNDYTNEGSASDLADGGFICEWDGLGVNVFQKDTQSLNLVVYENQEKDQNKGIKYRISEKTEVTDGTWKSVTGEDGSVKIADGKWTEATFSKKGYSTRTISKERLKESSKVYLQQNSDKPVINALWIDNTDVTNEEYAVDLLETDEVTLEAEIDWGKNQYGKVELAQKGKKQAFSNGVLRMVLKDKFDVSDTIYMRATDHAGNVTVRELKLEADGAVPSCLDGMSFSIDSKIGLTLPKSFPFVGGSKVGVDLAGFLPISVATEDNKVYATIGFDMVKYTTSKNYTAGKASKSKVKKETKFLFENIKDLVHLGDKDKTMQKLKNIKKTYGNAMKRPKGSFGFEADFTIIGYMEGYITPQNDFKILDGRVILNPSVSFDWSGQFAIGPVPCYWEAQVKGAIEAKVNIYRNEKAKSFMPAGDMSVPISGSIGAGVGINKVATIGGGGKLEFKPYVVFSTADPYFSVTTSINAYFKAKLGFLEYQYDFKPIKEWFMEYPETKKARSLNGTDTFDYYDTTQYKVQDLSYLDQGSLFTANKKTQMKSRSVGESTETILKTNTYSESLPKYAVFSDGCKLAVWVDSSSSSINEISLYYSYFDGSTWSVPTKIDGNGTVDFQPELAVIDDIAYVVWQDGRSEFTEQDTLETIASRMGISAAVFDRESRSFQTFAIEGNIAGLHMTPQICGGDGRAAVVWLDNEDYDWFGLNERNAIYASWFGDGQWSDPECLYSGLNSIISYSAGYVNGDLAVAFCEDQDNDLDTTGDFVLCLDGSRLEEAASGGQVSSPVIDGGSLYWYQNGAIMYRENLYEEGAIAVTEENRIGNDQYQVISNGENRAILYTVSEGLTSELYAIFQEPEFGEWGVPQAITGFGKSISSFDGMWTDNGMEILINRRDVTGDYEAEEPYGAAELVLLPLEQSCDIGIEEIAVDASTILAGTRTVFDVVLQNDGNRAGKYKINLLDSEGNTCGSMTSLDFILPGEQQTFSYPYTVLEGQIGKTLTFEVEELDGIDENSANNRKDFTLDYRDISLENTGWGQEMTGDISIYGTVVNRGYHEETGILVNLREGSEDGPVIEQKALGELSPFDSRYAAFRVPYTEGKIYYIEVVAPETDEQGGNNKDFVVLDTSVYEQPLEKKIYELRADKAKTVYTEGDAFHTSDLRVTAMYTDGTVIDVTKSAQLDCSKLNMKKAGVYTCTAAYGGMQAVFKITVNARANTVVPAPSKKKTLSLKVTAKKNAKKITVKTTKKSKVKVKLSRKILLKGRKKVRTVTISAAKNKTGTVKFKLSKKLPRKTVIIISVSKAGYRTKRKIIRIK